MTGGGDQSVEQWRIDLLDAATTALALLAALWGIAFLSTNLYGATRTSLGILPFLVLPAIRPLGFRVRRVSLVLALTALPLTAGAQTGASVGSVTGALMAVVAAGTLFGVRWATVTWLLTIALLALGWSLAADSVSYDPAISDVRVPLNLVRMLATYTALSSILLVGVVVVIRRLGESLRAARNSAAAELAARLAAESSDERRQEASRQMVEAQKYQVMGQLAGIMAHDINNSLQFIMLQAELMSRKPPTAASAKSVGTDIINVCQQASSLARQMLTLGQRAILDREVVDVAAELDKLQRGLQRTLASNVTLQLDCQPGLRAYLDKCQLQQALLNLTINAGHAMPDGGQLLLSAAASEPGMLEIAVRDTGTGMEPDVLAKIFEPFFTTKGSGGTGLGLPAVKAMVEQHGGRVRVESKLGEGTTFFLQLPAYAGDDADVNDVYTVEHDLHDLRILVVDDDPLVRRTIAEILSAAGAHVLQAADGDAALRLASDSTIDLLCTDAIMPGLPTRALIDHFRAQRAGFPVVVCSGYVESELLRRGIETKSIAFLAKPFSASHLLDKVSATLHAHAH